MPVKLLHKTKVGKLDLGKRTELVAEQCTPFTQCTNMTRSSSGHSEQAIFCQLVQASVADPQFPHHFDADDPFSQFDADPCGSGSTTRSRPKLSTYLLQVFRLRMPGISTVLFTFFGSISFFTRSRILLSMLKTMK